MTIGFQEIKIDPKIEKCIEDSIDCYGSCLETVTYCLMEGLDKDQRKNVDIGLFYNCAEINKRSASSLLKGLDFSDQICSATVEISEACTKECKKFPDDSQMQNCAELCRRAANSNRLLAKKMIRKETLTSHVSHDIRGAF